MNAFDFDLYDTNAFLTPESMSTPTSQLKLVPQQEKTSAAQTFDFDLYDPNAIAVKDESEGFLKSAARTALQIPQAMLEATTPFLLASLGQLAGYGEALDDEELERLSILAQERNIPFDRDEFKKTYDEGVNEALSVYPTVRNIGRGIESETGIPLEPKNLLQKGVRIGSFAGSNFPGTVAQKATTGAAGTAAYVSAIEAGVPEPIAELIPFAWRPTETGIIYPSSILPRETKPSGLPVRNYEGLKTPRDVSERQYQKLQNRIIDDFNKVSEDVFKGTTFDEVRGMIENPKYKQMVNEGFEEVKNLASQYPDIPNDSIKNSLEQTFNKNQVKGLAATEYDRDYAKVMQSIIDELPEGNSSVADLITRYRKNNSNLQPMMEPGASRLYNKAKRDAYLDMNRALANVLREKFPNSELVTLFDETNKNWSRIMDAESIQEFITDITEGKYKYAKGRQFFESANQSRPFKRLLGEENFKKFEQLLIDMQATEKTNKLIRSAKAKGYDEIAKTAFAFFIHPTVGYPKAAKDLWQLFIGAYIRWPKIGTSMEKAVNSFKAGDFKTADNAFKTVEAEILQAQDKPMPKEKPTTVEAKAERIEPRKQIEQNGPEIPTNQAQPPQFPPSAPILPPTQKSKPKSKNSVKALTVENIQKSNRSDITPKGLKQQKDYFINALEDALANPKEASHVNIEIPGDGKFKIKNEKSSLETALKKVKSKWPVNPQRSSQKKSPEYSEEHQKRMEDEYKASLQSKKHPEKPKSQPERQTTNYPSSDDVIDAIQIHAKGRKLMVEIVELEKELRNRSGRKSQRQGPLATKNIYKKLEKLNNEQINIRDQLKKISDYPKDVEDFIFDEVFNVPEKISDYWSYNVIKRYEKKFGKLNPEWQYTIEDFPTLKEAETFFNRKLYELKSEKLKKYRDSIQATIENMRYIIEQLKSQKVSKKK